MSQTFIGAKSSMTAANGQESPVIRPDPAGFAPWSYNKTIIS